MIDIKRKEDCVGCNACVQRCPVQCIFMNEDEQGFLYPKVDLEKCINCGLCEKVCPVINQAEPHKPDHTYAAWNTDEVVRMSSSSGGVFFALAKKIIEEGGVVFGAKFNENWEVVHDYAETLENVKAFQVSKYVQSKIGDSFRVAERILKEGRKVMFTGTPCQLAGLRLFLRKDYGEQLLKVDVVCHGVPSPMIWKEYLKTLMLPKGAEAGKNSVSLSLNEIPPIEYISFRDKRMGWEKYGFAVRTAATNGSGKNTVSPSAIRQEESEILYEPMNKNLYMLGFLKNIYLRPSCYECPAKCGKSYSNITLADFWGIKNYNSNLYNEKGVSLILTSGIALSEILNNNDSIYEEMSYIDALHGNPSIVESAIKPKEYYLFWKQFHITGFDALKKILEKMKPTFSQRMHKLIYSIMYRMIGFRNLQYILARIKYK